MSRDWREYMAFFRRSCNADARCGRLPAPLASPNGGRAADLAIFAGIGHTPPVGWTCMHAIEGLMLALVVAAAVVPQ